MDTTHCLPGELLDFIVCLPYLRDGCIVVIHDTIENHLTGVDLEIATKLLFDVVTANDKYMMKEQEIHGVDLPNIAAFKVGTETRKNIKDLFSILTVSWGYLLGVDEKQKYRDSILFNYGEEYLQLFDQVETLQRHTYLSKRIAEHYGRDARYLKMKWEKSKEVFIYGAGYYGDIYFQWGMLNGFNIKGFVISDDQEKVSSEKNKLPVYFLSELSCGSDECSIIVAVGREYQRLILQNLKRSGYYNIL